jgi:hypothetical protein
MCEDAERKLKMSRLEEIKDKIIAYYAPGLKLWLANDEWTMDEIKWLVEMVGRANRLFDATVCQHCRVDNRTCECGECPVDKWLKEVEG